MARMKAEDIREWDDVEINARLKEEQEAKFRLRFTSSMMELENHGAISDHRRNIAKLKTILRERELAGNE